MGDSAVTENAEKKPMRPTSAAAKPSEVTTKAVTLLNKDLAMVMRLEFDEFLGAEISFRSGINHRVGV